MMRHASRAVGRFHEIAKRSKMKNLGTVLFFVIVHMVGDLNAERQKLYEILPMTSFFLLVRGFRQR